MEGNKKELQLLPSPNRANLPRPTSESPNFHPTLNNTSYLETPTIDLQLSISLRPVRRPSNYQLPEMSSIEALKQQAAEQIRAAAVEKAYAERVRELARREMALAESEFTQAKRLKERAREEVERAQRLKEKAMRRRDSTCMELTCQGCRQRF